MSIPFEIPIINQDVVNGVSYAGSTLTLTRAEGDDLTTTITTTDNETKIENGTSKMEIATSNGACVFTPAGLTAKTTTFAADGKVDMSEEITFNSPNGIGQATSFSALPNIRVGSAYMNTLTGATGKFESLMSYTKIGNLININGYFVINVPSGTNSGTCYMNLADIGLPTGVNSGVYTITNSDTGANQISNTVTTDTTNNRLVFNFATSPGIQYLVFKMLLGCSFRISY